MKIEELKRIREQTAEEMVLGEGKARFQIRIAMGTSGIAVGSRAVRKAFLDEVDKRSLSGVLVMETGERGWASCEPVAEVRELGKESVFYSCLTIDKVRRIVDEHIVGGVPVSDYQIHPAG